MFLNYVVIFFYAIVAIREVSGDEIHEGLPFCGLKSVGDKFIFVSTLDGKLTTLNGDDGSVVWNLQTGVEPMLSSSIHRLELTSYGQLVRMIPSLSGGLYKFNGENIEPVPVSVDHLLQSSFRYSDDLVISGGKESHSFGVSMLNGDVLYECSMKSCGNHSEAPTGADIIVIQRQSQTVRAVEPRSGTEKWNFSVSQHDVKLFTECHHSSSDDEVNYHLHAIVPDGVVYATERDTSQVLWKYQFVAPVVNVWQLVNGKLIEVDLFSGSSWSQHNNALVSPSIYVGMHNKQLYIQESVMLQHKRQELAARYRYNLITDESKFPAIPWQPIPASQGSRGLLTHDTDSGKDTEIQPTALSVLYASSYVNGNGFYLYTEEESFRNSTCSTSADEEESDVETDDETPVQIVIVSLWYWWREVLVISVTTAIVFNFMFIRRIIEGLTRREAEETSQTKETLILPLSRSRNVSESQSTPEFTSRYLTDFEPVQCLGKGGFGVVFEAKNKIDECNYAIKRIVLPNKKSSRERVMREVKALAKLDHHHIVRYFNAWLEHPPPGWQEEHDKSWVNTDCSELCTSTSAPNTFHKPKLTLKLDNKVTDTSVCLNLGTPSSDKYETNTSVSDSFIVFASKSKTEESDVKVKESIINVNGETEEDSGQISTTTSDSLVSRQHSIPMPVSSKIYLYIQMQLCQRRSLREWLQENVDRNYKQVLQIFEQIVQAVEYVHLRELIHRDLKPSNIFFSPDGQIKIGDFGLVTSIHHEEEDVCDSTRSDGGKSSMDVDKHTAQVGTQFYMSPEQLTGKPYNYKVDIYSLGLIFFELLVSFSTQMERAEMLRNVRRSVFPEYFKHKYKDEFNLLKLMLSHDPDQRPTTIGIRSLEPLRQMTGEVDTIQDNSKWYFELPPKSRESSVTSISGSSTESFDVQR